MNSVIILAAGSGERFGGVKPKQFQTIRGQEIINFSIKTFQSHESINEVVLVVSQDWYDYTKKQMDRMGVKYHILKTDKPNQTMLIDDKVLNINNILGCIFILTGVLFSQLVPEIKKINYK